MAFLFSSASTGEYCRKGCYPWGVSSCILNTGPDFYQHPGHLALQREVHPTPPSSPALSRRVTTSRVWPLSTEKVPHPYLPQWYLHPLQFLSLSLESGLALTCLLPVGDDRSNDTRLPRPGSKPCSACLGLLEQPLGVQSCLVEV